MVSAGIWWHRLSPIVGLALFVVAVMVLGGELRKMPPRQLAATMRAAPTAALALAGLLTFLNYLILTGYDQLAFVYIRRPIARWQIAMASFVGYAIANNVGFALLSGTSARYRFYSRWGLSGEDISRVVLFYSSTYWLGLNVVGGWALAGGEIQGIDAYVPAALARLTGWVFLASALAYPLFVLMRRTPLCVGGVRIELPSMGLVGSQFLLSLLDWIVAAAVLYVLVPGAAARLPLLPRRVPRRAAGRADQPRARRARRLRVADGAAAPAARVDDAAGAGAVQGHLLPGPAGRGAAGADRRRDLAAAAPGRAVGQRVRHADRVGGAEAAGDLHDARRRRPAGLGRHARQRRPADRGSAGGCRCRSSSSRISAPA